MGSSKVGRIYIFSVSIPVFMKNRLLFSVFTPQVHNPAKESQNAGNEW